MASLWLGSPLIYRNAPPSGLQKRRRPPPSRFTCSNIVAETTSPEAVVPRRSGNYRPSLWDQNLIYSLHNKYAKESKVQERAQLFKEDVRKMLNETEAPLKQLELIDTLQRLGVSYHFDLEIRTILTKIYEGRRKNSGKITSVEDLYATALEFRLLRQHGFDVSEDVFEEIKNEKEYETFLKGSDDDAKVLLCLYDASFLSIESDTSVKEIRSYTKNRLLRFVTKSNASDGKESYIREMVIRSLEMPHHWRTLKLEARWYIDMYNKRDDMNPLLLHFAKLDFNIVQANYQEDLKSAFRWWSETGLKQLDFARDRILESYFWTVALFQEPQFRYERLELTKFFALITTIDDIYYVYGTLDELELFTEAVRRWDVKFVDELPEYMRLCFLVLYNEVNQEGHNILRDKKFNVIPFINKAWTNQVEAYLKEAKWDRSGYKPRFEEYLENGWVSIGAPVILTHCYCVLSDRISNETIDKWSSEYAQHIVRASALVVRLTDDIGTTPEELARGDVMKSMQCYMNETGATEKEAHELMMGMISDGWNVLNYEKIVHSSSLDRRFLESALDLERIAQCMYQYGDGHGFPEKAMTIDRAQSLFFDPVPLS